MKNKTIEKWNNSAKIYAEAQEDNEFAIINKKIVCERFKDLTDKKILDLGCGYGNYANYFHSIGADATGCDGSEKLVQIAKEKYPYLNFNVVDIDKQFPYEDDSFDLVFCNQVLMDIENLENAFHESYRITKPNGTFYFSIVHPAFYDGEWAKDIKGFKSKRILKKYLSEYNFDNDFWGKTTHYHRTISKYINTAIETDFKLVRLEEPVTYDGVTKSKEFPLFLFTEFVK